MAAAAARKEKEREGGAASGRKISRKYTSSDLNALKQIALVFCSW